jgi:hypothetical protein
MYLWVILVAKAAAVALSGAVGNTGLVAIANDAVTTAKILDGTILAADIAADAVTTKDFRRYDSSR